VNHRAEQFVMTFVAGMVAGLVGCIMAEDILHSSPASEKAACKDGSDTKAYMSRLPGEGHNVERCVRMIRFGSPRWVPELGHPLNPNKRQPDAAWLLEALDQFSRESQ
jgi:hypothetical protein